MRLPVRVTPRGGRDASDGWALDPAGRPYLKIRVSAPAADGEANAALIAFLAKALKRPKSAVRLISGETARLKMIGVDGLEDSAVEAAFGKPPAGS